jgi:DNA-binding transcriptional MerR regulator
VHNIRVADAGEELSIEELAERAGVSVRTVRYYINQGLLAGPAARGRNASYTDEHLARLRLIRRLVEQHVPLAEQRQQLQGVSYAQVRALLDDEERHGTALHRASATRSPGDYIGELLTRARSARGYAPPPVASRVPAGPSPSRAVRSPVPPPSLSSNSSTADSETWQHWQLAPALELHVRADHARPYNRLIERLLETAREALGRDR